MQSNRTKWVRLAFACLSGATLFAQSDNSYITGLVKDPSGAAVANASVVVTNEGNGFVRSVKTNESGVYNASNLQPGYYTVAVEAPGFKKSSQTRNKLEAAIPLNVSVDLSGWEFDRGVNFDFPRGTQIAGGGFLVLVASQATFQVDHPGISAVPGEWEGSLGSREDTLVLKDASGNVAR